MEFKSMKAKSDECAREERVFTQAQLHFDERAGEIVFSDINENNHQREKQVHLFVELVEQVPEQVKKTVSDFLSDISLD